MKNKVKYRRITVILIFAVILTAAGVLCYQTGLAATVTVGTVNTQGSSLTVRSGPGTNYSRLGSLTKGTTVTITGEENGWYKIVYGNGEGYVSKEYIADVHTEERNDEYYNSLVAQGFPADYAEKLTQIHEKYPTWKFEPVMTGLEWETVITEESRLGRNLVQSQSNDAQKSTASGAYDFATNYWYGFDGASWVCASNEMIAYCMDPRNFLDEASVFQFETLSYQEYQTVSGTASMLSGTFMAGDYTEPDGSNGNYAQTFTDIGQELGISPYHLAARCKQEQGTKGTSGSVSGTYPGYEGYFNFFNVGAYASGGRTAVENGLIYAKKQGWNTRYASIKGGSAVVANNYVLKGQNTIYFEKFNVVNTSNLYGHQYMTNVQAAISEGKTSKKAYTDLNQEFVFRIPVYNHMPETPCELPQSGNPNNWLSALSVTNYNLTPSFQGGVTEYSFIVSSEVSSIEVAAAPVASTSSIAGTGTRSLNYGSNRIEVVCTAQNGNNRTYVLNVVRQQPEGGNEEEQPSVSVMYGDLNGDGKISNADIVLMKKHILEITTLTGNALEAADVNHDGRISNADVVLMKKHILGIAVIQ